MKKKILLSLALMAVMCLSVSAITVYNHTFDEPSRDVSGAKNAAIPNGTITQGWWYVVAGGWCTNGGLGMTYSPGKANSMAAYIGWMGPGNNDIRQDIPGPTNGDPDTPYSTTPFTSGTTYTITYSYKGQYGNSVISNRCFIRNRDAGMGAWNAYILDETIDPIANGSQFLSVSYDFTAVSRTNRLAFRLVGANNEAVLLDNITIEEANEKNFSFEFGSFHGWTAEGLCWNGGPYSGGTGFDIASNRDGDYAVISYMGGEPQTGTLKSKNFTIPTGEYIQFLLGGYSHAGIGPGSDYNYVALYDAESEIQLGTNMYCPGKTTLMSSYIIVPPAAYTGTGSNVYIKVVDDSAGTAYAWLSFDKLELVPEPATLGLLAILGLAFLRRK